MIPPPRVVSNWLVAALLAKAESEGGFGAVLARGDPEAGSILVVLRERNGDSCLYERLLDSEGAYRWQESARRGADAPGGWREFLEKARKFDRDLWVIELDIPSRERFAAEMNAIG